MALLSTAARQKLRTTAATPHDRIGE